MIYLLPLMNHFFKLLVVLTSVELVFSLFMDVSVLPFNILASQMAISIIKCWVLLYCVRKSAIWLFWEFIFKHIRNQRDLLRRTVNKTKKQKQKITVTVYLINMSINLTSISIDLMYLYHWYGHGLININKIQCN